jgi:hypothetical protein
MPLSSHMVNQMAAFLSVRERMIRFWWLTPEKRSSFRKPQFGDAHIPVGLVFGFRKCFRVLRTVRTVRASRIAWQKTAHLTERHHPTCQMARSLIQLLSAFVPLGKVLFPSGDRVKAIGRESFQLPPFSAYPKSHWRRGKDSLPKAQP